MVRSSAVAPASAARRARGDVVPGAVTQARPVRSGGTDQGRRPAGRGASVVTGPSSPIRRSLRSRPLARPGLAQIPTCPTSVRDFGVAEAES